VTPKIPLNLGVAAIFGLGLGFCAAFLQERLDDTLKGTEDVERLFGLSAVGLIPAVPQLNGNHPSVSKLPGTRQGSRSQRKWQRPQAGFGMASH